jgi:hypothetical protein
MLQLPFASLVSYCTASFWSFMSVNIAKAVANGLMGYFTCVAGQFAGAGRFMVVDVDTYSSTYVLLRCSEIPGELKWVVESSWQIVPKSVGTKTRREARAGRGNRHESYKVKNKEKRTQRHTQANIMMKREDYFYRGAIYRF